MSVRRFLAAGAVSLAVAACGGAAATGGAGQSAGGGAGSSLSPSGTGTAIQSQAPAGSGAGPVTGHVGDKLTFASSSGAAVDATLVKVFDPATPNADSEAPLPSASHWVGVEVTVDNHGDYENESSNFDAVTSTGSPASLTAGGAVLGDGFTGCTQTAGDEQDSAIYTHCVAFVVPDGQTLASVGLQVGLVGPTDEATWTLP
ncbi:MAG TPA: hypothetical protein VKR24_09335 [Candidatus Limnocylindrales bacterium]|nr:hypothetical protein [Candidatus Limnocylindrales bacterium]